MARDSEKRTNHRPVLSDLRDSGSIEQDADIVLFLYREDYYSAENEPGQETDRNSGECIVAKNRHGEAKTVLLHWQGEFYAFYSAGGCAPCPMRRGMRPLKQLKKKSEG